MATKEVIPLPNHGRNYGVTIPDLKLTVGFFTQVTGFSSQVDVLEYPEGGVNTFVHRLPSRIKQGNITLKRGISAKVELLAWFEETVVKASPKNLSITLFGTENDQLQTWSFRNAYPVKWTSSDLNAGGTEFLTESIEIAHNGMTVQ